MKLNRIYRKQLIKSDINNVWKYFSSPVNLPEITPGWLNFKIISGVPEKMYEGLVIEYRVSPFLNMKVKWITEITYVKEPYFFVDEQRFGPYRFWHHKHFFEETNDGNVLMTDEVHYIAPLNFLTGAVISKKLNDIFDYRYNKIEENFNRERL